MASRAGTDLFEPVEDTCDHKDPNCGHWMTEVKPIYPAGTYAEDKGDLRDFCGEQPADPDQTEDRRETVADKANGAVAGERQKNYGPPTENFERVALLWNAYLTGKYHPFVYDEDNSFAIKPLELDLRDYSAMMRLVKEARLMNGYHEDSQVDICGYSICDQRVEEGW